MTSSPCSGCSVGSSGGMNVSGHDGKARSIDKVLLQGRDDGGFDDVIVWPSSTSAMNGSKRNLGNEEDVLLGYEEAEPSRARHQPMPRRSSLSSANDPTKRSHRRASIGYSGEMTLVLPNTKQKVTKRRSITFSDDDTVHSIDTFDDSDADDEILNTKRQLWFREEEYRHIERNLRHQLKQQSSGSTARPTWIETRGLESVLDDTSQTERANAIRGVLDDQRRQQAAGIFDEHAIAAEYKYNSMDAQLLATERAKQDEDSVQQYLEKTRQLNQKFQQRLQQRRASC